ncbi:hypothetical protein [Kribbella soli]|uniref:Uncharacterized protein n=1 Tax=Kribbella soli TaxID=1124743 RepID=A0A4R0GUB0_9ACTN|nr:hypothetical protein [Kribbella soli]TCC01331.1 hypothetical protein E0H45_42180 [Kribbella soli]
MTDRSELVRRLADVVQRDQALGFVSEEQRRLLLDTTREEKLAVANAAAAAALARLEEAGVLRQRTVLDADLRVFVAMAACWKLLESWWPQPMMQDKPLEQVLQVIPRDVAESVVRLLRQAGLLPADSEVEGD